LELRRRLLGKSRNPSRLLSLRSLRWPSRMMTLRGWSSKNKLEIEVKLKPKMDGLVQARKEMVEAWDVTKAVKDELKELSGMLFASRKMK
ncbi:unnamed protein product, partial [Ilex paraguariensis]